MHNFVILQVSQTLRDHNTEVDFSVQWHCVHILSKIITEVRKLDVVREQIIFEMRVIFSEVILAQKYGKSIFDLFEDILLMVYSTSLTNFKWLFVLMFNDHFLFQRWFWCDNVYLCSCIYSIGTNVPVDELSQVDLSKTSTIDFFAFA